MQDSIGRHLAKEVGRLDELYGALAFRFQSLQDRQLRPEQEPQGEPPMERAGLSLPPLLLKAKKVEKTR